MVYMNVYYNDQLLLQQYPIADLDEDKFDAIIQSFS